MPEFKLKNKKWNKEWEEEIAEEWKSKNIYKFNKKTNKKVYSIDTPPPYVNAPIHIGHATTYTIMDMFARFRRLIGYEVLFPLGLDRNGLPIEMAAQKIYNVSPNKVSREEFINVCKKLLEEYSMKSAETFFRLGISFNSWDVGRDIGNAYLTDMPEYRALTQATFIEMWKRGLIYEGKYISNYCVELKTTVADSEMEYKEVEGYLNYISFKVKETGKEIIIATTRPELLGACQMIIFNPEDKRYKDLEGKHIILPLYEREVPIKPHPYAKMDFGTGLVMMCSFGDYADIRFFREQNLKPIILIDENGKMNKKSKFLEGLTVKEAREKIVEILNNKGLLVKREKIKHKIPVCERTKTPIEFIPLKEFYLKQVKFKKEIKNISRKIKFFSEESRQILDNWLDSISFDWPISRRRYYATEIPLWYCKRCGEPIVPEPGKYYIPWKEKPPIDKCPKCGSKEFVGETRVLDTWFDSSITPLFIGGYLRDNDFFKKIDGKITLRPQGKEIIRTWLYYTLLRCYLITGKEIFDHVWIHYHVLDEKGNKMSKSLGNVIDPQQILNKYGAEPFRLWCAFEGNMHKGDFRISYERIESASKFLTKLWNVSRFISAFKYVKSVKELTHLDKSILSLHNKIIDEVYEKYMKYEVHDVAMILQNYLWDIFASQYIEMVKPRVYNNQGTYTKKEQESALYTLHKILQDILIMLHPIIPFITYKIMKEIYNTNIVNMSFPEKIEIMSVEPSFEEIMEINKSIWKFKKENNMSLKDEINKIKINKKFEKIEKDIISMHHVKSIEYWDSKEVLIE